MVVTRPVETGSVFLEVHHGTVKGLFYFLRRNDVAQETGAKFVP